MVLNKIINFELKQKWHVIVGWVLVQVLHQAQELQVMNLDLGLLWLIKKG